MSDNETIENNLLIKFIFKKHKKKFCRAKYFIQNKPYQIGLKIKNIDKKASSSAIIKKLKIIPAKDESIVRDMPEEFNLPVLNPGQEIDLWRPNPIALIIKDSCWIKCDIVPSEQNININTYQVNIYSKEPEKFNGINRWGDTFLIRGDMEETQSKTNLLLLILTILMFLDGVRGLGTIWNSVVKNIGILLSKLGEFLIKL